MAATLWDETDRRKVIARFERMNQNSLPQWGKMDAGRMVVHVTDTLRLGLGELQCAPRKSPLAVPGVKQLVMFHLPWPKGVPTAPELLSRKPVDWLGERERLVSTIHRFAERGQSGAWPLHPAFGRITGNEWGRLMHRHLDHHLTQFGA